MVAAVHGAAAGGGFSLAISCDLIVATEPARFAMPAPKPGSRRKDLPRDHLPRLVGMRRRRSSTSRRGSSRRKSPGGFMSSASYRTTTSWRRLLGSPATRHRPDVGPGSFHKRLLHAGPRPWRRRWSTRHDPRRYLARSDAREGTSTFTEKHTLVRGRVNRPRFYRPRVHRLQFAQPQV